MLTDIRVLETDVYVSRETARESLKFGNVIVDNCLYCHARVTVENARGHVADGWGAIFLMDMWGWPSAAVSHVDREVALQRVTEAFAQNLSRSRDYAHPLSVFMEAERDLPAIAGSVAGGLGAQESIPPLAALISASPLDMALHDAFGNVNGIHTYQGYGPEFMRFDLGAYLGPGFKGRYISDYLISAATPRLPVFHLVGGLDQIHKDELTGADDDLPRSLEDWIERDGLFCFKVKLRGNDLSWDLERFLHVVTVVRELATIVPCPPVFSVDTNEQCESAEYIVEFLRRLAEQDAPAFDALLYVEQPVTRNLAANPHDMRAVARLKPVILDEGLASLQDFDLALTLGWSGIALKTCKCHSKDLLFVCLAEQRGIPYTVQDLTNPGLALLHSVGFAARTHPLVGVETNSRQYFPATSAAEASVHPDIFSVKEGFVRTDSLYGSGFGFRTDEIPRPIFRSSHSRPRGSDVRVDGRDSLRLE
ncbi:MAG TPA: enolase C-terminal domain-like protein [bacterium]|nr:enolase C-terminal domain-like protein [bacterium]